jgi:hypothetical protein
MIEKEKLEKECKIISLNPNVANLLILKLGFILDDYRDPVTDYTINYNEILNCISFWLSNPKVTEIELGMKFTSKTIDFFKSISNEHGIIDSLESNINNYN